MVPAIRDGRVVTKYRLCERALFFRVTLTVPVGAVRLASFRPSFKLMSGPLNGGRSVELNRSPCRVVDCQPVGRAFRLVPGLRRRIQISRVFHSGPGNRTGWESSASANLAVESSDFLSVTIIFLMGFPPRNGLYRGTERLARTGADSGAPGEKRGDRHKGYRDDCDDRRTR